MIDIPPPDVAAIQADPALLLAAFIDECRDIGGTSEGALAFAKSLRKAALIGTSAAVDDVFAHIQDFSSASVSQESSSTQWLRSMDALALASLCQAGIEYFKKEVAAGGEENMPPPNSSTYGSFC